MSRNKQFNNGGMNIIELIILVNIVFLIMSCAFKTPKLKVSGMCVESTNNRIIRSLYIDNLDNVSQRYIISRDNISSGSVKVCLNNISEQYVIKSAGKIIKIDSLPFKVGERLEICNSGGDRSSFCVKVVVEGNIFKVLESD